MKTEHSKNRSAKQEYWQEHIRSWESSGLTQSSYCRENMLSLATFGYWRRKSSLKVSHEPQPRFFPLAVQSQVQEKQSSGFNTVRLVLQERRFMIEVEENFSASTLRRLITTLEQI